MTANGAEIRFWALLRHHQPDRASSTTTPPAGRPTAPSSVQFATDGAINVCTDRAGSPNGYTTDAYTPVGTYAVGWTQYRVVYDFTAPRPTRCPSAPTPPTPGRS